MRLSPHGPTSSHMSRSGIVPGTNGRRERYHSCKLRRETKRRQRMLGWALTFLIIALIAAVLGFGGIAGLSLEIAKIIFFVAIVLFAISAIVGLVRGRSPTLP